MDDDRNADRGCCDVTRVRAIDNGQPSEHVAVRTTTNSHGCRLPALPDQRPTSRIFAHQLVWEWIRSKLGHRAQVAQEVDSIGSPGICHRDLSDLHW